MGRVKKKRNQGKNKYYSLSNKLRKDNKSHDEFEVMLNNLSLEEIIGLKLELAARSVGVRVEKFSIGFPPRFITLTSVDNGFDITIFFFRFLKMFCTMCSP